MVMRIPWWIWLLLGIGLINLIVPDPIPGIDEILPFLIPAIFFINLLRKGSMRNFYQQQYKQYQTAGAHGTGAGSGTTYGSAGAGAGQSSSSFYNRFRGWGQGFQQPGQTTETMKNPYEVLGIKKGASMDEIKKAYRGQLKKFHPDIVENLKLGPEYREMFEDKTREIHKAYQSLGGK
jgi:hypothetical protein